MSSKFLLPMDSIIWEFSKSFASLINFTLQQSLDILTRRLFSGPFDLLSAEATAQGTSVGTVTTIMEVLTLLQTDISDDSSINSIKRRAQALDRKIIGNKEFDVEVIGTAIKIYSRPFIHALQKLVSYWPDISLVANSIVGVL